MQSTFEKLGTSLKRVINVKSLVAVIAIALISLVPLYRYSLNCIQKTEVALGLSAQKGLWAFRDYVAGKDLDREDVDTFDISRCMKDFEQKMEKVNCRGTIDYHVEYKRLYGESKGRKTMVVVAVIHRKAPWYIDTEKTRVQDARIRMKFAGELNHLKPKDSGSDSVLGSRLIVSWAFSDDQTFFNVAQ